MTLKLIESVQTLPAVSQGEGVFEVRLINTGWGSSGYYSEELLQEHGPKTFKANIPMFDTHPLDGDPSTRKVGDIVAKLQEDAYYRDGALYAKILVREDWIEKVNFFKDTVGLSIFATGEGKEAEVGGRTGVVVESFDHDNPFTSVDFVVAPGRGGKVMHMAESAVFEEGTANERREELRTLLSNSDDYVYVLDFNQDTVWYEDGSKIYQVGYSTVGDVANAIVGEPIEVVQQFAYKPKNIQENILEEQKDKEKRMDFKKELEDLTAKVDGLIEALTPSAPTEELDRADIVEQAIEAGLNKAARARVLKDVEAGTEATAAIEAEKVIRDAYLEEAQKAFEEDEGVGRVRNSQGSAALVERFEALEF